MIVYPPRNADRGSEERRRHKSRVRPDVVFLDIGMPGMDGYAVCRCTRAYPWGNDLAIFAMTGWGARRRTVAGPRRRDSAAGAEIWVLG